MFCLHVPLYEARLSDGVKGARPTPHRTEPCKQGIFWFSEIDTNRGSCTVSKIDPSTVTGEVLTWLELTPTEKRAV